ncbi:hypothetical protein BDL97_16G032800 [Sphagnum fallax]|nr:hypothetical protein BDL97_16G032800 [Sphagnum fallax]
MDSRTPVCSPSPPPQQQQLLVAGSLLLPGGSQYMARSDAATNKRSDREHLLELEHKLLEARQRLQDLKDDTTGGNACWPKVSSGCKCYPPSRSLRDSQKLNMSTTSGLSLRSNAESSRRSRTSHHRQRQPVTRSGHILSTTGDALMQDGVLSHLFLLCKFLLVCSCCLSRYKT